MRINLTKKDLVNLIYMQIGFSKQISENLIEKETLDRLKIKNQTAREFQEQGLLNRAMNLSYFELLGGAQKINEEKNIYQQVFLRL